jgi:peptide/nickel transport system substrate-binding protein
VPVGNDPAGLAVADGALWVSDASNRVVDRVDTRSKTVVDTIGVGNGPTAVAVSGGTVWVVNSLDATVSAIDAKNDKVIGTTPVGGLPNALATGDDGVWVANSSSASVSRIDPVSHRVTATIPVGNEPSALAVIGGDVWVANALDGTLSRIDAATNSVTETIQVGGQPNALAADGGTMWVGDAVGDHVSEIDAASGRVSHVVPLGDTPNALVVAAGRLWVSAGGSAALHRGGTLNVAIDPTESINSLDPAVGYRTVSWSIESVIYDGLVTFRRVGGPGGTQVVPDLAQELPSVTDAGRSYTFQLRRGVRFSDGSVVKPSDVARSFARMLPLSQASPYYSAIIGASQCASGHCAGLSRGIVADDAANTVTLHLTHPDPELLYKLALPFASVLGGSPPHHDARLRPLVGTGPYVIDPNPAKDHLTLERNPRFRQWSPAAQPSGYPNSIDATFVRGRSARAQAVTATGRGTYDIAPDLLTSQELSGLRRDRPTQLHPFRESFTSFFFLNTRIAPFNDVRVRRAVNYAFDRKREVAAFGGQFFATVTCQVLPPTLFGFRPYCPYTTGADASGVWRHPDLARARSLVRAAGVRGDTVRVAVNSTQTQPYAELEKTLRTLGFHVTTHVVPNHIGGYYLYVDHLANHVQTGLDGWFADFPAPSNFIETLLSCTSIAHASSGLTPNDADFCNRSIDAEISRALALQTTDPASAAASWSHIDRQITDLAPWVPLVNDQGWDLVSSRVGNYQHNPEWGVLLDQLWVH